MLSVLVPAYNEGNHIYDNLLKIDEELNSFCDSYEIIFVNDGSTDCTLEAAKKAAEQANSIEIVSYEKNQGKGNAIREGFKTASKELITFLDADLDIPPQQIRTLLNTITETGADVVVQSKRHPDSQVNGFPVKRRFLSRSYSCLIKGLYGLPVSDTQVGIKLYRREVLERRCVTDAACS